MGFTRKCQLCGTSYEYCFHCDKFRGEPKWKVMFHDNNCNTIFNTLQLYSQQKLTAQEAACKLKECDLTVLEKSTEAIRSQVEAIFEESKIKRVTKTKQVIKVVERPVESESVQVDNDEETEVTVDETESVIEDEEIISNDDTDNTTSETTQVETDENVEVESSEEDETDKE